MIPSSVFKTVITFLFLLLALPASSVSATEQPRDECLERAKAVFRELRRQNAKCSKAAKRACNDAEECACDRRVINCDNEPARLRYYIECLVAVTDTDPACRIQASFEDGEEPDAELEVECLVE